MAAGGVSYPGDPAPGVPGIAAGDDDDEEEDEDEEDSEVDGERLRCCCWGCSV